MIESILIILEGRKLKKYPGRSMTSTQAGRSRVQARVREKISGGTHSQGSTSEG